MLQKYRVPGHFDKEIKTTASYKAQHININCGLEFEVLALGL